MQVLNIFHVLIAIAMIAFILIQKGAGATAGAAFGSGASGTVFGSRGAGSFLSHSTWVLATLFCLISLSMAVIASRSSMEPETDLGVVSGAPATEQVEDQAQTGLPEGLPVVEGVDDSSDLPSLDSAAAVSAETVYGGEETAGDLPVIESVTGSEEEPAEEQQDPAVGDGPGSGG